jgi:hypothetical protein
LPDLWFEVLHRAEFYWRRLPARRARKSVLVVCSCLPHRWTIVTLRRQERYIKQ